MKFIPILFSTPMVQAINADRKTCTRRTQGLEAINANPSDWKLLKVIKTTCRFYTTEENNPNPLRRFYLFEHKNSEVCKIECPYGVIRDNPYFKDILWVRESYCFVSLDHAHNLLEGAKDNSQFVYKANMHPDWMKYAKEKYGYKWRPSIHMPKVACRSWLELKSIELERLQDISEADAICEGIERTVPIYPSPDDRAPRYIYPDYTGESDGCETARVSFATLWQKLNGPESWDANPWVWVIRFKQVEKPSNFLTQK